LALLGRESIVPRQPDRIFFEVAPPLLLVAALLAAAVLPLSPSRIVADLATGALFVNAALAYVMVALIMAGWGPDGTYAMVGGFRFLGQLIAYSMLIVMPITAVAMRAESLFTTEVVESQAALPNAIYQPVGFVAFVVAAMAVAFLPPLDLPTAPGELAGGVEAEYTGWRLAVMRLARAVLVVTLAAAISVFYLGGWLGPVLPPWAWSALKTLLVAAAMLLAGRYLPRLRETHVLEWGWKIGIPLALFNIFYVGVLLLVVE
ncbi:MAG: NADH-quinone oxidoreductase subunit H, partial [Actinomycetota bacterium]|nr:NADH-quinone oxidoreductase subunit H [Actinomycetota bacterium]